MDAVKLILLAFSDSFTACLESEFLDFEDTQSFPEFSCKKWKIVHKTFEVEKEKIRAIEKFQLSAILVVFPFSDILWFLSIHIFSYFLNLY